MFPQLSQKRDEQNFFLKSTTEEQDIFTSIQNVLNVLVVPVSRFTPL